MTEGFEDTGYENTWTERGAAGGDEDYSLPGTPPTGGCSQGLYFNVNEAADWSVYDHGSALDTGSTIVTVEFYVRLVTTVGTGDSFYIYSFGTSSTSYTTGSIARITIQENGGDIEVQAWGSVASSNWITLPNPTTTYNKITLVMHTTAASSYIAVNDGTQETFTRGTNSATQYHHLGAVSAGTGDTAQMVFDLFEY
jgi:hypothetical protein